MTTAEPVPGERWRHTDSCKLYRVVTVARMEDDGARVVVYTIGPGADVWVRPLDVFLRRFHREDPPR